MELPGSTSNDKDLKMYAKIITVLYITFIHINVNYFLQCFTLVSHFCLSLFKMTK